MSDDKREENRIEIAEDERPAESAQETLSIPPADPAAAEQDGQAVSIESAAEATPPPAVDTVYRHSIPVRLAHWLNVICLPILVMTGFQIFNAHQALYWGERSDRDRPVLSIKAMRMERGEIKGVTTVLGHSFDTTGVLGFSAGSVRAFPSWATIPSGKWLAMGRQWHLFFAWIFVLNGLLFGLYALASRHFWRDLFPKLRDLRGIGRDVVNHLRFRHPSGEEARRYNVMQKLAYTGVIFGLGPPKALYRWTTETSWERRVLTSANSASKRVRWAVSTSR